MREGQFSTKFRSVSLIEVLLAIALFSFLTVFLVSALIYGQESGIQAASRVRANLIAEEGLEAARGIRNESFENLSDGNYGLSFAGGKWKLVETPDSVEGFSRQLTVSTISDSVKKIKSSVSWPQGQDRTGAVSHEFYLSNWSKEQPGDGWEDPTPEEPLPLPDDIPGIKIQTQGNYAYVVRSAAAANFIVVDITDPETPQIKSTLDLPGEPTNIAVSGAYAYVSNKDNQQNIQIINITNPESPAFNPEHSFKGIGNEPGTSIAIKESRVYLTREYKNISNSPTFYAVDVSNPEAPTSLGYLRLREPVFNLPVSAFDVAVSGNYAYVASGFLRQGLGIIPYIQTIDISQDQPVLKKSSTPFNLQQWNFGNAISISSFENTVVLGQEGPAKKVYVYDAANPQDPALRGAYSASGRVNDLAFGNNKDFAYLATEAPDQEFQIINVSNPSTPLLVGKIDLPDILRGVCYSWDKDRVFAVGGENNGGFLIIKPQ